VIALRGGVRRHARTPLLRRRTSHRIGAGPSAPWTPRRASRTLGAMLTAADTAYAIAHIRAAEARRPEAERLFDDPYAPIFDAAGEHAREGTARFLALPFLADAVRLRTRLIDDAVRDGIGAGVEQLLLLGAGFDARGLRLGEVAARGVRVFEVDFAHLQATKRALLDAAGVAVPPGLAFVPSDFAVPDFDAPLGADLVAAGFRRDRPAVVVWEGVIGYIADAAIDRTLRFVAGLAPGTRLVFTYADPKATGADEAMPARAVRCGFASCEEHGFDSVWRRYCSGEPHEHAWVNRVGIARAA
jgi:methyltransferase (TIGR00027 family)